MVPFDLRVVPDGVQPPRTLQVSSKVTEVNFFFFMYLKVLLNARLFEQVNGFVEGFMKNHHGFIFHTLSLLPACIRHNASHSIWWRTLKIGGMKRL